jgi:hypothetical protein
MSASKTRICRRASRPTCSKASHQRATARRIWTVSFQRAERPRERRLTILM